MTIQALKDAADAAGEAFDAVCRPHYPDGRWGAYRAYETDQPVPNEVDDAMSVYHAATQAYYLARDGKRGFLGYPTELTPEGEQTVIPGCERVAPSQTQLDLWG